MKMKVQKKKTWVLNFQGICYELLKYMRKGFFLQDKKVVIIEHRREKRSGIVARPLGRPVLAVFLYMMRSNF